MLPPSLPKRNEGAARWLIKIVAGLFIVVLLGIHFVVNHAIVPGGLLTYADVVNYYQNPIVVTMEILFLIVVVIHAFLGLRSIILDLNPAANVLKAVNYFLLVFGAASIVYGIWLALTVASRG